MIQVVFFASVKEQVGRASVALEPDQGLRTVEDVRLDLSSRGPQWQAALAQENLICALNHSVVSADTQISDGDEVAFYPPVTGG